MDGDKVSGKKGTPQTVYVSFSLNSTLLFEAFTHRDRFRLTDKNSNQRFSSRRQDLSVTSLQEVPFLKLLLLLISNKNNPTIATLNLSTTLMVWSSVGSNSLPTVVVSSSSGDDRLSRFPRTRFFFLFDISLYHLFDASITFL